MNIEERETVIRIGYGPNPDVSVWSTERGVWAKCKKANWKLVGESKHASGRVIGQEWEASRRDIMISYKKPGRESIRRGFAVHPQNIRKGL